MKFINVDRIIYRKTNKYGEIVSSEEIDSLPTVDLVFCKNCKYSEELSLISFRKDTLIRCNANKKLVHSYDFCSEGEEKE